ncbi:MAG: RNA polymerase factor sigma-54 [Candidatus Manganitrophaceae bacterium]
MSWSDSGMRARLDLKMSQKLIMTPQLQQAIKLLQLSRLELSQVINQEMLENPVLEDIVSDAADEETSQTPVEGEGEKGEDAPAEEADGFDLKWEDYYMEDDREEPGSYASASLEERPSYEQTLAKTTSLEEHLLWQLGLSAVTEREKEIGTVLIGNIDDNGYLSVALDEIAGTVSTSIEMVEKVLKVIQGFDPTGVGARDLKECLLIQTAQLGLEGTLVDLIIQGHLEDLEKKRYQNIAKGCNVSLPEVLQAAKVIEHLEPKPGRPFSATENQNITPDVYVVKSEGKYVVLLNDDGLPKLKISPYYRTLLRSGEPVGDSTRSYLEEKFRSALWLVRSIEQRNRTIQRVAQSIVQFQYEFMEKGIGYLKPLILRQVADDIEMHESTVSRVTTNKYMYTPQGIFELKFFFNSSLPRVGDALESHSSVVVREMIRKMVAEEDPSRPLKDQEIVEHLKKNDVEIARRTVTKYRAGLNIPPASQRKKSY